MVFCLGCNPSYNHKGKFKHIRVPETSDDSVPMSIREAWIDVELETCPSQNVWAFYIREIWMRVNCGNTIQ